MINAIFMNTTVRPDQVKHLAKQGIPAMAFDEENTKMVDFDELQSH